FTNNNLPIGMGRGYTEGEAMGAARVVVLGATVADVLFPEGGPLGQHVRLGRLDLEVIGTLERQGGSPFGGNPDNLASIPIALFLGGIGVMNLMLVAGAGRTRGTALRRALGARRGRVLMQFVIEAVLLAFFGGVLGVALGFLATWLARFLEFPADVPMWAVGL